MCQFSVTTDNLTFLPQICAKRKLGFEIPKTNVGIRISIFEIPCVPIFRQNGQLWLFGPKFAQKWILVSNFWKSKSGFGINTSTLSCVPIFRQNGQHLVFRPKFMEIAQLCAIFWFKYYWRELVGGLNELGGVEVDGAGWRGLHSLVLPFDDTFRNLSLVVSYTPVILHSQWHYWSSSLYKGYPWYNVPSHTISRSWDTSGGWGVGEGVYPLAPPSHIPSMPMYNTCSQAVYPVMLLSWSAASLKVIFRTTCFAYSVFASKFWKTMMNIPRMYLTVSSKWL